MISGETQKEVNLFFENEHYMLEKTKNTIRQAVFKYLQQGIVLTLCRKLLRNKRVVFYLKIIDRKVYFWW